MLRLKRRSSDTVSIVWKERTSPSKRLVSKGFACSLLIHAVMLLLFQVRIRYTETFGNTPPPTVFLDTEESSVAILSDSKSVDEDPRYRFSRELHLTPSTISSSIFAVPSSYAQSLASLHSSQDKKREFLPIINLPWSFSDEFSPSHHLCRVYPLKISLHQQLRSLQLIDDGSRLFRKASFQTVFSTPAFAEMQPRVVFKVEVMVANGKIIQATCLRELTDKRLQGVANHVIKNLRFGPSENMSGTTISGILALQFSGTFDTICTLLDSEQIS